MNARWLQLSVGLAMLASAGAAVALKPTHRLSAEGPRVDLQKMIPEAFREWRAEPGLAPRVVNPVIAEKLKRLYNQTLARTYVDGAGHAIMLSIAYGSNQADQSLKIHRPEFCYVAQGFRITEKSTSQIKTPWGLLPVRRLVATRGPRREPITYWITVGDNATLPGFGRKLLQLKYGLTGQIPDGMLIRVSSVDRNDTEAYRLQTRFIQTLLASIVDDSPKLVGRNLSRFGLASD